MEAIADKIKADPCEGFIRDKNRKEWLAIDDPCREDLDTSNPEARLAEDDVFRYRSPELHHHIFCQGSQVLSRELPLCTCWGRCICSMVGGPPRRTLESAW